MRYIRYESNLLCKTKIQLSEIEIFGETPSSIEFIGSHLEVFPSCHISIELAKRLCSVKQQFTTTSLEIKYTSSCRQNITHAYVFRFLSLSKVGYYYRQLEKYFESLRYRNHINGSSYSFNITELTDLKANILPLEASLEYIDKATASIKLRRSRRMGSTAHYSRHIIRFKSIFCADNIS